MADTLRELVAAEVERQLRLNLRVELCTVIDVQRHAFEDDTFTNTVTVKVRDNIGYYKPCAEVDRQRVFQVQGYMGHHYGHPEHPRVGDLVWVLFYQNEKAIILGAAPNWEQLPVCRQNDDDQVYKFCQHKLPTTFDECGDIVGQFPEPDNPDCFKFYGKDRCTIMVNECPLGDTDKPCQTCKDIEDITNLSKSIKMFSKDHPDHPNRIRYSHKTGSFIQFEDDGSILIRDSTGSFICLRGEEGGILIKDRAGSYIALNGNGTLTVRGAQNGSHNLHNTCCNCGCCDTCNMCPDGSDSMGGTCTDKQMSD